MQITPGKYRTRDGQEITIEGMCGTYASGRFWPNHTRYNWHLNGKFVGSVVREHPMDLVAIWDDHRPTIEHDRYSLLHRPHCSCGWAGGFHRVEDDAYGQFYQHTSRMTAPPDFSAMAGHPKVETQVDMEATRRMTASEVNSEQQRLLFNQKLNQLVREHQLASDQFTEQQLAEAFRQALACGDFQRHVAPQGSQVVYLPFAREQHLQERLDTQSKQLLETVNDRNSLGVQLDLLRDELQRISARIIESGLQENLHLSCILDYCQRSQKDIEVRYTPIQERDSAQKEVTRLTQRIDSQTREIGRLKNLVAQAFEEGTQNGRALVNPRQWAESRSKRLMEGQL